MPRRIQPACDSSAFWLIAINVQDYRDERHRQELELEKATGGYSADKADYFARGGKPLTTYKDWLKSQKISDAEQAAREGPVSHEVYTPDPGKWGTDDDAPAWATASRRIAAAPHPDLEANRQICGCVHPSCGRVLTGLHHAAFNLLGASFDDPAGWTHHTSFTPSPIAVQGARAYASLRGLPDPHSGATDYLGARRTPQSVKATAQAYDSLPDYDPAAIKHFEAMRQGVNDQHDFMTKRLGIKTQAVDHDPYSDVHEMLADINNNKRLQVLGTHATGGHPYFDNATNDKFRAVHDFFGHAATGRSFDRHGEQATYLAHAQMFHPEARSALASETRGQNSSLILNGGFGPQKISIMPKQFWSGSSPLHLSAVDDFDRDLTQHLDEHGGTTFKEHPGDGPTSGYMVSQTPDNKLPVDDYQRRVREIRDRNRGKLGPDEYNGVWKEPDAVYHEVAKNHPEYSKAQQDAYDRDQIAFYDLGHGTEIDTAATQYNGQPGIWMARRWYR